MSRILIVVDMQGDFISGSLGSDMARAIVPGVAQRIADAARDGEQVIFTLDTHEPDYMTTHEGRMLPVSHCIRGSEGWRLDPAIDEARNGCPGARVMEKPAFGSERLARELAEQAQREGCNGGRGMEIELCGLCTDICVVSNALLLRAALPEAELRVQSRLCAGVTAQKHDAALEVMRSCQIEVI